MPARSSDASLRAKLEARRAARELAEAIPVARPLCARCGRPQRVCCCAYLPTIAASTPLLVVQHPREEEMPIGTARMATLCLPRSTLVVGLEVDDDPRVRAVLDDPARRPILLWPSPGATDLATHPPEGPTSLVVVDGTWPLAKKLLRLNPRLASLPRYALGPGAPSEYRIRKEPREGCISTIEAVVRALGHLERDEGRFAPMLEPFRAMIDAQLACEAGPDAGRARSRRTPRPRRPRPVPAAFADPSRIVVVAGEANAWPYDARPRPADELVHWVAARLDGSARLEAFARPTGPLAPSTARHARLDPAAIDGADPAEGLLSRWRAFVRDEDVLVAWGPYATDLLRAAGGHVPIHRVDLRAAVAAFLGDRAGVMTDACAKLGLSPQPAGVGRAGERLGAMLALASHLASALAARPGQGQ